MDPIVMAIILGLLGGIIHQLHDSEEKNEPQKIGRSAIIGAVAGLLTYFVDPNIATNTLGYVGLFVSGYFGDSVILNVVRRYGKAE